MEEWKDRRLEDWNTGRMEYWERILENCYELRVGESEAFKSINSRKKRPL